MKSSMSIVGSLLIAAVAFVSGLAVSDFLGIGRGDGGLVKIRNESGSRLSSVVVEIDTCGHKLDISAGELSNGAMTEVHYVICGEGGQTIRAILADGKVLASRQEYVESGYRGSIEVSTSGIK
jgi:hypothetical protein